MKMFSNRGLEILDSICQIGNTNYTWKENVERVRVVRHSKATAKPNFTI